MSVNLSEFKFGLVIVCGIILFALMALIFFVVLLRKRHNYFLQQKQLLQVQHESVLLQSQIEVQEQLFTQISSEIHDNIGQALSLVRLNLNTLDKTNDSDKILSTDEILGKAIEDLRTLSHNLHTQHIKDSGLAVAVAELLSSLERTALFKTSQIAAEDFSDLSDEQTLIVFRIIQEAVTNIVRHAKADQIAIEMLNEAESKFIRIKDNGKGFVTGFPGQGIGMKNMQARAKTVGAELSFNSQVGEGTEVLIRFVG